MIAYKVVNKRNGSLCVDFLPFGSNHKMNRYAIKYSIGTIITISQKTIGMFLCTTLEEAEDWKDRFSHLKPKILRVETLDNSFIPREMCNSINPDDIDCFYKNKEYKERCILLNTICSHNIKVLEEINE